MNTGLTFTRLPFEPGERIPNEYTCEGEGDSPPLAWQGVPDGCESLALIVDDPDAPGGTFAHWLLANLPPGRTHLPRQVDLSTPVAEGPTPVEGTNDFGRVGYGGPCPPRGDGSHRYVFHLYGLDTVLDVDSGVRRAELLSSLEDHILSRAEVAGTFER